MARERAKLTDKQERILVQCQLMGLTTRDMTQISNRLVALEKEREWRADIDNAASGCTWEKLKVHGWKITASDGKIYECTRHVKSKRSQSYWDRSVYAWNINVSKPGTRFKGKILQDITFHIDPYVTARICPENSKELYGLLKAIKNGRMN
jgi:hypothetical protein